jgi:hypothetical protein
MWILIEIRKRKANVCEDIGFSHFLEKKLSKNLVVSKKVSIFASELINKCSLKEKY